MSLSTAHKVGEKLPPSEKKTLDHYLITFDAAMKKQATAFEALVKAQSSGFDRYMADHVAVMNAQTNEIAALRKQVEDHKAETGRRLLENSLFSQQAASDSLLAIQKHQETIAQHRQNLLEIAQAQVGNVPMTDHQAISNKLDSGLDEVRGKLNHMGERLTKLTRLIEITQNHLEKKMAVHAIDLQSKIAEKPSDLPQVEERIQSQLDAYRNDFEGYKHVLSVMQHDAYITKKTIEGIYSRIGKK